MQTNFEHEMRKLAEQRQTLQMEIADQARAASNPAVQAYTNPQATVRPCFVDLTAAECRAFDVQRAIGLAARGETASAGGFEAAIARDMAARMSDSRPMPHRTYLPWQVLARDLFVATGTAGGNMIATTVVAPRNTLFPASAAIQAGAQVLVGLQDNAVAPRFSTVGTGQWLANETTQATETSPLSAAYTMVPKNFAAYAEMSRQWLRQTGGGDLILNHLQRVGAAGLDAAALGGPGTAGQPTGISATAGVGSVVGTSLAFGGVLEFQTDASGVGDPQSFAYVTTPAVAALLAQRAAVTNVTPMWEGPVAGAGARMAGRPGFATINCPSGAVIGGDFAELAIGLWGPGVALDFNPYANFPAGIVGARVWMSADIAVLTPGAFSIATSVT